MSFKVKNTTNTPIHVRVSNAGITYWYRNWLEAGQEYTFENPSAIWFDLTFAYATKDNEIDPSHDNVGAIGGWISTVLGILSTIVGAALVIVPGAQPLSALVIAGGVSAIAGVLITVGGVCVTIAQTAYFPATVKEIYGANDYEFTVTGGFTIEPDPQHPDQFLITAGSPIGADWRNLSRGTFGHVGGAAVPLPHSVARDLTAPHVAVGALASNPDGGDPNVFERNGRKFISVRLKAHEPA